MSVVIIINNLKMYNIKVLLIFLYNIDIIIIMENSYYSYLFVDV